MSDKVKLAWPDGGPLAPVPPRPWNLNPPLPPGWVDPECGRFDEKGNYRK
jgi:hypothetical protein